MKKIAKLFVICMLIMQSSLYVDGSKMVSAEDGTQMISDDVLNSQENNTTESEDGEEEEIDHQKAAKGVDEDGEDESEKEEKEGAEKEPNKSAGTEEVGTNETNFEAFGMGLGSIAPMSVPNSSYIMATNDDFDGQFNGNFRYIGSEEYVEIPHIINGVNITVHQNLFNNKSVKGVKSTNKNVTDMYGMFLDSQATGLDVSHLDTSGVITMQNMFNGSQAKKINFGNFDTRSVTNMASMFAYSQASTLDVSSFDTSNVTNMRLMFRHSQATTLDLSGFDTSSVTDMNRMFWYNQATTLDLSSFDTSSVVTMYEMFSDSQASTLDLSNFDTSSVTDMQYMFRNSQATTGYARTQKDANRFNSSSGKPSGLVFVSVEKDVDFSTDGSSIYEKEHATKVNVTGHDTSKSLQYTWSTSTDTPSDGWTDFSGGDTLTHNSGTGSYYLHVRGTGWLDDPISATSKEFKFDNTNPTISLLASPSSYTNGDVTITAKATDAHSGVKRIRVADGDWENAYEMTFSVSQNGSYTFEAEDAAGNTTSETIEIVNIDNTNPTAPIISAPTSWQKDDVSVFIADGEVGGSGVDHTEYRLNGGEWLTYAGEFIITENGETLVEARTVDKANNKGEIVSRTVKLDKENPSLVLTPDPSHPTNQDVVITAKATDAHSGVKRIHVADGDWEDADEMEFVVSENGTYIFEVEDKAGNTTSKTIEITNINKTVPTLTLLGAKIITLEIGDTYDELGATSTDAVDADITSSIKITGNVDTSKQGTYTVRYNVADAAGNQAIEVTREVRVVAPKNISLVLGGSPINVYADSIVNIKDSDASIQLPNDLPVGTTLQVKSVQNISTSGYNLAGELYEFIFTFPNGDEEYTGEYTLTLGVDETKRNAAIYYYNENNKVWEFIGGQIDDGKITATVDHFSIYGVLTKQSSGGGSGYVPSNDSQLASLTVSENGEPLKLTPTFAADIFDYQLETNAAEISLALKPAHNKAKVYVEGEEITDSLQVELNEGDNVLRIIVKAEDGSEKKYTLTIHHKKDEVTKPVVSFTDITGHYWAEAFIMQGAKDGIIKGFPDGTFKPNQYLTRAQTASLIVRALGLKTDKIAPFSDIGGYAAETQAEIEAAYHYNIIRGYPDGTFKPAEKVTRAHMALMLNRAYNQQKGMDYVVNEIAPYSDIKGYDEETVNAITMLYELGIATGSDGKYMPGGFATRAHAAKMLVNFFGEMK